MNVSRLCYRILGFICVLGAVTAVSMTPMTLAQSAPTSSSGASSIVQAQQVQMEAETLEPGRLSTRVTDASGVLTPEQAVELENSLNQIITDHHRSIFLVLLPSFGGYSNTEWTELAVEANGGGNTLVLAVATDDRQYGLTADINAGYWSDAELDSIDSAIFPSLAEAHWAGVGYATVDEVRATIPAIEETTVENQAEQGAVQALPRLLDVSGALVPEQFTELEGMLMQFETEHQRPISIAYIPSLEDEAWLQWSDQLNTSTQYRDLLVVGMATDTGEYTVASGTPTTNWKADQVDYVKSEVKTAMNETGWFGAGRTAVESAARSLEVFDDSAKQPEYRPSLPKKAANDSGLSFGPFLITLGIWLVLFLMFLGMGYGFYRLKRKEKADKKKEYETKFAEDLGRARKLSPQDRFELEQLPINALEARADELIVETDESLRNATDELKHAEAEFGSLRVRELSQAVESIEATLQQAHLMREGTDDPTSAGKAQKPPIFIQLNNLLHRALENNQKRKKSVPDSGQQKSPVLIKMTIWVQNEYQEWRALSVEEPTDNPQKRGMLVEIISSCGRALESLREQLTHLVALRSEIAGAGAKLSELTKRSVSLHTRFTAAGSTWDGVKSRHSSMILASIDNNVELAAAALDEASKQMDYAREQQVMPAGEQGGLIGAMRGAERALELTDEYLLGIEHADNNIAAARDGLQPLIQQVRDEISEARQLKEQGLREGTSAGWDALENAVNDATTVMERAEVEGVEDPLGAYTELIKVDTRLDEQLDAVRHSIAARSHQLTMLDKQWENARVQIQAADDLISSHGAAVQDQARTYLVTAKQLTVRALELRKSKTHEAMEYAHQASQQALWAVRQAQQDIEASQEQMESSDSPQRVEKPRSGSLSSFAMGVVSGKLFEDTSSYGRATSREETNEERKERLKKEQKRQREEQRRREEPKQNGTRGGYSSRGGSF